MLSREPGNCYWIAEYSPYLIWIALNAVTDDFISITPAKTHANKAVAEWEKLRDYVDGILKA